MADWRDWRTIAVIDRGPRGERGAKGETGADSVVPGPQGERGEKGERGERGQRGEVGPPGEQGQMGNPGLQGERGEPGHGVRMLGTIPDIGELPTEGMTEGDTWVTEDTGTGFTWNGEDWVSMGTVRGPAGLQGDQGNPGSPGEPGETGRPGTQWIQGGEEPDPEQGNVGDWYIDTFTWEVFFKEDAETWVSHGIIKGPKGNTGAGLNILGVYDTIGELEEAHPTGSPGDAYLIRGVLWVWDEIAGQWVEGTQVMGPQGEKGDQGVNATTLTVTAAFTVPPYGQTALAEVAEASWVVPGQMVWIGQNGDAGAFKVTAVNGNELTLLNPEPGGTGDGVPGGPGEPGLNASFYGEDLINDGNYSVTVNNQFELTEGVAVFVKILKANTIDGPTLDVNGTGAKAIRTRAGIALSIGELNPGSGFGVLYNGESFLLTTPVARLGTFLNPGTFSVECAGYDSVSIDITIALPVPANPGGVCTLQNLGYGVPVVYQCFNNATGAARSWGLGCTNPEGVAVPAWWIWSNTINGTSSLVRCDTANNVANNARVLLLGTLQKGGLFTK